jgi:hypothetical protein
VRREVLDVDLDAGAVRGEILDRRAALFPDEVRVVASPSQLARRAGSVIASQRSSTSVA